MEEERQKLIDALKEAPAVLSFCEPFIPEEKPAKRYKSKMPKVEVLNVIDLPPASETPIITPANIDTQKELLIAGAKLVLAHYKTKHKILSLGDYKSPGLKELAQALE